MAGRVVVVGLGPAGPDLVTAGALAAIERSAHRFLRTTRHPAASVVGAATSFDEVYERSASMEQVYAGIVDELAAAATEHGEVLYAVPGSPLVAEHTVELLLADERVEVEVLPALSFLDLAWVRLGVDPIAVGARVVDGHRFSTEAAGERGPLLVAQCDRRSVLSDIKLSVDEPPERQVTVLSRLGLPDERVAQVAWADLDRAVEPDHLTSIWIPELAAPVAGEVQGFVELVARLREECPWDREQTHRSLARHLLEESYEVLDVLHAMPDDAGAIDPVAADADAGDDAAAALDDAYDHLEEELGDLLFQIVFHARLGAEAGRFTLADVAQRIHDKLVARHPHVFGDVEVDGDPRRVEANWDVIKKEEQGRASTFDGIPSALPALARTAKLLTRAERAGIDPAPTGPTRGVAGSTSLDADAVGALLLEVVVAAHAAGVDPEEALRLAAARHEAVLRDREAR